MQNKPDSIKIIVALMISLLGITNVDVAAAQYSQNNAVEVGSNPTRIAINVNTNMIYVANSGDSTISVIDGSSNKVVDTINLGVMELMPSYKDRIDNVIRDKIYDIGINEDTNILYVAKNYYFTIVPTGQDYASVMIAINASTHKIISTTKISYGYDDVPIKMAIDSQHNLVYFIESDPWFCPEDQICELSAPQYIYALDGSSFTAQEYSYVNSYDNAINIFFDPQNNQLFTSSLRAPSISATDAYGKPSTTSLSDLVIQGEFITEGNITGLAFDPTYNMIYAAVASLDASFFAKVNPATNWTVEKLDIARPAEIAFNPVTNQVYITQPEENQISVIDPSVPRISQSIQVGGNPVSVALNPRTNTLYVSNQADNSVTIIDSTTNTVIPEFGGSLVIIVAVVSFAAVIAYRQVMKWAIELR